MERLIIANWKMNPGSIKDANQLLVGIKPTADKLSKVQTVIAPPFLYLTELGEIYPGRKIKFAAQDVFWEKKGSFTGEISSTMLKDLGVEYVIVGHSERRALGESNEDVNQKVLATVQSGLTAVVCVGESDRDHKNGTHLSFITEQIETALSDVPKNKISKIVIAYEPIWAIGKSGEDAMKPDELHGTVVLIRKIITNLFDKKLALKVPVLYGGSVEKGNTRALLTEGMVDGLLVGHASLSERDFSSLLLTAEEVS